MRNFDPTFEPKGMVGVRRLEVITGVGGRRAWSHEDKGRIVAESFAAGANVSAVARRYGLRPQQVYAWRRLARGGALALPGGRDIPRAERKSRFATDLYGAFPVKGLFPPWLGSRSADCSFGFADSSLFGAGKAVLRPVACDQVPGARGRGQGT